MLRLEPDSPAFFLETAAHGRIAFGRYTGTRAGRVEEKLAPAPEEASPERLLDALVTVHAVDTGGRDIEHQIELTLSERQRFAELFHERNYSGATTGAGQDSAVPDDPVTAIHTRWVAD